MSALEIIGASALYILATLAVAYAVTIVVIIIGGRRGGGLEIFGLVPYTFFGPIILSAAGGLVWLGMMIGAQP